MERPRLLVECLRSRPNENAEDRVCRDRGSTSRLLRLFVHRDGDAHAICYVALHRHAGNAEASFDCILGSWDEDDPDRITFGCRVGQVVGQTEPAASLVSGAIPYSERTIWGKKLTREEALVHPRLQEYWEVVDYLLVNDREIHSHVHTRGS